MMLNQLVEDIRVEPWLWSSKTRTKPEDQEQAWRRIAQKNNLSAGEAKLIFREISKKYKEEKKKPKSTWKLLDALGFLDDNTQIGSNNFHKPIASQKQSPAALKPTVQQQQLPENVTIKEEPEESITNSQTNTSDEDIYVELLEVGDEEESSDEDGSLRDVRAHLPSYKDSKKASPVFEAQNQSNQDKVISVLTPSSINSSISKINSTAARASTNIPPTSMTTIPTPHKIPSIFSAIKRKLPNGIELKANGSNSLQPPEKQSKIVQDKKDEGRQVSISPTPATKQSPPLDKDMATKQPAIAKPTNSPTGSDVDENPMKVVCMDTHSVNIGDVIPMPAAQKLNVEKLDDAVVLPISNNIKSQQLSSKSGQCASETSTSSTPHSKMYDSFGQYVANTLTTLSEKLANKLEIKILEAIIAINTEKNNLE